MEINEGMNISSAMDLLKNGFTSNGSKSTGFDDVLNNMTTKDSKQESYKTENNSRNSTVANNNVASNNTKNKASNEFKPKDKTVDTDKAENKVKNENSNKDDKVEKNDDDKVKNKEVEKEEKLPKEDKKSEEEKAIKLLSEILGVSAEVLVKAMEELGLTTLDLENNENLMKLLVEVNGLSEQAELLNLDNLSEQIKQVKELVAEVSEQGKIDLAGLEKVDKSSEIDENELTEMLETLDETEDVTFADTQSGLNEGETDENQNQEEVATTNTKNSTLATETSPQVAINPEIEVMEDMGNDDIILGDQIAVNGVSKNDTFVEQVGREISGRNINTADVVKQLVEAMKVEVKADTTSEIKIMLRPQHLGDVTLKIATENGIVVAQFVAENEKIKAIIESNFNTLRDNLLEQGVDVGQLEVTVRDNSSNSDDSDSYGRANSNGNDQIDGLESESIEKNTSSEDKNKALGSTVDYSA